MDENTTNSEVFEMFSEEAQDLLGTLESDILKLESDPGDETVISSIFRCFHSLKGGAGWLNLNQLKNYAHQVENYLAEVRDGNVLITSEIISLLFDSLDCLTGFMDELKGIATLDQAHVQANLNRFRDLFPANELNASSKTGAYSYTIKVEQSNESTEKKTQRVNEMLQELEKIGEVIAIENDVAEGVLNIELVSEETFDVVDHFIKMVSLQGDVTVTDTSAQLDGVQRIGEILVDREIVSESDVHNALDKQTPLGQILVDEGKLSVSDLQKTLDIQNEQKQNGVANEKLQESKYIRADIAKLDTLLNLVGEAIIHQTQYVQLIQQLDQLREREELLSKVLEMHNLDLEDFQEQTIMVLDEMEENLRQIKNKGSQIMMDIQSQVMTVRMVTIGGLFNSFRRMVRDYAVESGKKIQFDIQGQSTELDKTIIERLSNPLKHMIRNAIDHGLEMPDERIKKGKNPQGIIKLNAAHKEGRIVITISDDGAGIDPKKVMTKAMEIGGIREDEVLSENEIFHLLFTPGFSTASQVTDISGRGVGMDVVKKEIEALNGVIEIKSRIGLGTAFLIKLPLTLAIIDGMLVDIGKNRFIIPLLSVIESFQPTSGQLKKIKDKGELVDIRGIYLPLIRLYRLFDLEPASSDPTKGLIVVVEDDGQKLCLLVDEAIDQQQVVIKSLEENFYKKEGIAGATVLGDGRVSFILDIPGILHQAAVCKNESLSVN